MKDMYELDLVQIHRIQAALVIAASTEDDAAAAMSVFAERMACNGWSEEEELAREAAKAALARAAEYRGLIKVFE